MSHRIEAIACQLGHNPYCHIEYVDGEHGDRFPNGLRAGVLCIHHSAPNASHSGILTASMRSAILKAFKEIERSTPECQIIILTSDSPRVFSLGINRVNFSDAVGTNSIASNINTSISSFVTLADLTSSISKSSKIVIAIVSGLTYSWGLELALAADYRVAVPHSIFSFPEAHLGLIPCGGGVQRLTRLVGVRAALGILCTSRKVRAIEALKLGLIDLLMDPSESPATMPARFANFPSWKDILKFTLYTISENALTSSVTAKSTLKGNSLALRKRSLEVDRSKIGYPLLNKAIFSWTERKLRNSLPRNVRSPISAVAMVRMAASCSSFEDGLEAERKAFLTALQSSHAKAMQYVLQAAAATSADLHAASKYSLFADPDLLSFRVLGVLGGGKRGIKVAFMALKMGLRVLLMDVDAQTCQSARSAILNFLTHDALNQSISESFKESCMSRLRILSVSTDYLPDDLAHVDILVECIPQSQPRKQQFFSEIERHCAADSIIIATSSMYSINEIALHMKNPSRLVGVHFISSAYKSSLVEVVSGERTSTRTLRAAVWFGDRVLRCVVAKVPDTTPSIGCRLIYAALYQAFALIEEGCFPHEVDRVLRKKVNFSIGIFEMEDFMGFDGLSRRFQDESVRKNLPTKDVFTVPDTLTQNGSVGVSVGSGWYLYDTSGQTKKSKNINQDSFPSEALYISPAWGMVTLARSFAPQHSRSVDTLILNVCKKKGINRRDVSDKEIGERIILALINEAANLLYEGVVKSSALLDSIIVFGYGYPAWQGGICYYADHECDLKTVVKRIEVYHLSQNKKGFPSVSPLLKRMAEENTTFGILYP